MLPPRRPGARHEAVAAITTTSTTSRATCLMVRPFRSGCANLLPDSGACQQRAHAVSSNQLNTDHTSERANPEQSGDAKPQGHGSGRLGCRRGSTGEASASIRARVFFFRDCPSDGAPPHPSRPHRGAAGIPGGARRSPNPARRSGAIRRNVVSPRLSPSRPSPFDPRMDKLSSTGGDVLRCPPEGQGGVGPRACPGNRGRCTLPKLLMIRYSMSDHGSGPGHVLPSEAANEDGGRSQ